MRNCSYKRNLPNIASTDMIALSGPLFVEALAKVAILKRKAMGIFYNSYQSHVCILCPHPYIDPDRKNS